MDNFKSWSRAFSLYTNHIGKKIFSQMFHKKFWWKRGFKETIWSFPHYMAATPITCHWSLSVTHGNTRNLWFYVFREVKKDTSGIKWLSTRYRSAIKKLKQHLLHPKKNIWKSEKINNFCIGVSEINIISRVRKVIFSI